jgi:hypothetical protein
MRVSSGYMNAFILNLGAFLFNLVFFIIWYHSGHFAASVIHAGLGAFSFVLMMVNLSRYLDTKFKEDMEETYRRIYGKRY